MPNYKIYFNDKPLILSSDPELYESSYKTRNFLFGQYRGKVKELFHFIDSLEKPSPFEGAVIYHSDYKRIKKDFKGLFNIIHASGGIVDNGEDELLFIFRKGHWDLPKGKIEDNERRKEAAIREVMEETGVRGLSHVKKFTKTKHVYRNGNNQRVLKISTWYTMKARKQKLIPEESEDISRAEWRSIDEILASNEPVFANILDLLENYVNNS